MSKYPDKLHERVPMTDATDQSAEVRALAGMLRKETIELAHVAAAALLRQADEIARLERERREAVCYCEGADEENFHLKRRAEAAESEIARLLDLGDKKHAEYLSWRRRSEAAESQVRQLQEALESLLDVCKDGLWESADRREDVRDAMNLARAVMSNAQ